MSKIIDGSAMIQRVRELYEKGKVDLSYYNIVKEAVQMEPSVKTHTPIEPMFTPEIEPDMSHWDCGACGAFIWGNAYPGASKDSRPKYCSYCGQAVKWE
jgi:hypothetical protein